MALYFLCITFGERLRFMETIQIDILNPKAKKIIEDLEELKLISIREKPTFDSMELLLKTLRNKRPKISNEEIRKEVESVRTKRYAKKT